MDQNQNEGELATESVTQTWPEGIDAKKEEESRTKHSGSSESTNSRQRRTYKCFNLCPFPRISPGLVARMALRNIVVPKDMWDEFPDGIPRYSFFCKSCRLDYIEPVLSNYCYRLCTIS